MPLPLASAAQGPPHSPRASSCCHRSRNRQLGCQNSRIRKSHRTVADAAVVKLAYTWVNIVADAVYVGVGLTRTAAFAKGVKLVAVAVTIAFWDVRTSAVVDRTRTVADAAVIKLANTLVDVSQMPSMSASASQGPPHRQGRRAGCRRSRIASWDVRTSAVVDGARTVADATSIKLFNMQAMSASASHGPPH